MLFSRSMTPLEERAVWAHIAQSDRTARVYQALLQAQALRLQDVAEVLSEPRSTLQASLEWLLARELVQKEVRSREVWYRALSPSRWLTVCEERCHEAQEWRRRAEQALPGWLAMYDERHRPRVRAFEGGEGLSRVREEIASMKGEIWEYFAVDEKLRQLAAYDAPKRIAVSAGVGGRVLLALASLDDHPPMFDRRGFEVRWIPLNEAPFAGSLSLVEDRAYLIASSDEQVGLVMESPDMVGLMRSLYERSWSLAKPWHPPTGWGV